MTTADKLRGLMEDTSYRERGDPIVVRCGLLPALAAVVEAAGHIVRAYDATMEPCPFGVDDIRAALSALDAAVSREVG